ncbi:YceI family protein [Salimicrobium flavidum]|uniref:Polyisoprenoid-binding protein YceI n=1 Tax=Salimicrobium flavidum TaxID=570947 RepID=A0A1N7KS04_9BACI|nr:YceI family protein [Salimicrobium flavidum]SIS64286.1 Polyisoprenoid-binding protein YceI [Salimicrobium flavidum]
MEKAVWKIDKAHSVVGFTVKHMRISNVKGTFDEFEGTAEADPNDLTDASIDVKIEAASINTKKKKRDNHLRSADFFDVENYPYVTFKATDIKEKSKERYDVTGDFTMRGVTKPVTFDVTFEGVAKDPMTGEEAAGFTGSTAISREDFGVTWNAALETGGVVIGDEVKINIEIQIRK